MTINQPQWVKLPRYVDPNLCSVGMPALSSVYGRARNNHLWARLWNQSGMLAAYSGNPSITQNGNLLSKFYVIYHTPVFTDTTNTSSGSITAFADAGGGEVTVTTSAAHGLTTGDIVNITDTTNYNNSDIVVTVVDTTNFKITDAWAGDDATGNFNQNGAPPFRYIGGASFLWDYSSGGEVPQAAQWYADKDNAAVTKTFWQDGSGAPHTYTGTTTPTCANWPDGGYKSGKVLPPLELLTTGGFNCGLLNTSKYLFAAISFWHLPDIFSNQNDYNLMENYCAKENWNQQRFLRGYDSAGTPNEGTSAANIIHNMNSTGDSASFNTHRCLFQTCYPGGIWLENTAAWTEHRYRTYSGTDYGFDYRKHPRNLKGSTTDITCYPACVLTTTGAGDKSIRFTSVRTSETWTLTITGAETAAAHYFDDTDATASTGNGLSCKADWDEIRIEMQTDGADSIRVHTVALFEPEVAS